MSSFVSICLYFFISIYASNCQYVPATCALVSPCKCRYPSGGGIDLSTLDPAMIDLPSSLNDTQYIYHPCQPVVKTVCPNNAAFCSKTNDEFQVLGTLQNVTFGKNATDKSTYVQYMYDVNNVTHTTILVLKCAYTAVNSTIEQDPLVPERFVLRSKASCFTKVELPLLEEEGLSTGSVLVIMVLVFAALYFLGGMAVLKFIRGASGVEIIPHYEFWSDLPFLVRDGVAFTLGGCQGSASYDRI